MDTTYRVAVSSYALDTRYHRVTRSGRRSTPFENRDVSRLDLIETIYTGHPITTWHRNHWRAGNNYDSGQAIGLDFDTEDERSRLLLWPRTSLSPSMAR